MNPDNKSTFLRTGPFSQLLFALFAVFLFSSAAMSQDIPPKALYLELVDYENKPVANAVVKSQWRSTVQTNRNGLLESPVLIRLGDHRVPYFSIEKSGFFTFFDYFSIYDLLGYRLDNKEEPIRIELLKIPQNAIEKRAIGNEQQKRDYFSAARLGDGETVEKFLRSGLSPNLTTSSLRGVPLDTDLPVLYYAALSGNPTTVKALLDAGADARKKNESAPNFLTTYLLASPFQQCYPQTEPVKARTLDEFEDGAVRLIRAGAGVENEEYINEHALVVAAGKGYVKSVKEILNRHFRNDLENPIVSFALITAVTNQQQEIVEQLLKEGADRNYLANNSESEDYNRCTSALMNAAAVRNPDLISLLIEKGARPDLMCRNGQTALRVSIKQKHDDIYVLLVNLGAGIYLKDGNGDTNLMYAVQERNVYAAKRLSAAQVPVNAKNGNGTTALMMGVNNLEIAKVLLEAGADPNIANESKFYSQYEGKDVQRCETALINLAQNGDYDERHQILDLLIAHKVDVNYTCENGESALMATIMGSHVNTFKKLIVAGADITGESGRKLLEFARKRSVSDSNKQQLGEIIEILEAAVGK